MTKDTSSVNAFGEAYLQRIKLDIKFMKKVHNLFKKVLHFSRGGVKMG